VSAPRVPRRAWILCAALTSVALVLHLACASWLAARDPLALAARGHWVVPALAAGSLGAARAFLLFAAPGWWLWLLVRAVLAGLLERRALEYTKRDGQTPRHR
jgi:hypothetical protein